MAFHLHLGTDTVQRAHPGPAVCVKRQTPLAEVMQLLRGEARGCVLVCEQGRLIGIFTERDALRQMAGSFDGDQPIGSIMSEQPASVMRDETVESAIRKMSDGGYRHLPILDEQLQPVGVLSVANILHYLVEHFPHYVYNLPPGPHHAVQNREGA